MGVQPVMLFTEHQLNVLAMMADILSYLQPEDRRAVTEAALAVANDEDVKLSYRTGRNGR